MVKRILIILLYLAVLILVISLIQRGANRKINRLADDLEKQKQETLIAHEREEALRQEKDEEIATLRGALDSANTVIDRALERAGEAEAQAENRKKENEKLRKEVQPVIDANPKLKNYVDSLYKTIVDLDTVILSQKEALRVWVEEKEPAYQRLILAEKEISESWKRQYENEQGLRIAAEKAFQQCRILRKRSQVREKLIGAAAGIGGVLLGSALH